MLWAQHADASAHYGRPEQSQVICWRVIVFDCWQLTNYQLLPTPEASVSGRCHGGHKHKAYSHSNWSGCCAFSRSPSSKGLCFNRRPTRSDVSERSAFSELLPSKDWLLEANFGRKLELKIGMCSWSNVSERRSQRPCVRSQTQRFFGFLCPASPSPEKRN